MFIFRRERLKVRPTNCNITQLSQIVRLLSGRMERERSNRRPRNAIHNIILINFFLKCANISCCSSIDTEIYHQFNEK